MTQDGRRAGKGSDAAREEPSEIVRVPLEAELDLHSFAPQDIPSVVDEYLQAAHEAGFTEVRIVHGRGRGIQRGIVQQILDRHALVAEFDDDRASQLGATLVRLSRVSRFSRLGSRF
jgi:DNA-nicking Smr family endonuclease